MQIQIRTALAVVFLASLPLHLRAAPQSSLGEPLTSKEVRKAEMEAKTASDHRRLAVYYESRAQQMRTKLSDAEDTMNHWARAGMADRTKVPNAYTSSKTVADNYRIEMEKSLRLAATHRKMADSLQASAGG